VQGGLNLHSFEHSSYSDYPPITGYIVYCPFGSRSHLLIYPLGCTATTKVC